MFIDVHAHLNNDKLFPIVDSVIDSAKNAKVEKIINASCDIDSTKMSIMLTKKYENIFATLGIHPQDCFSYGKEIEEIILSEKDNEKVVGIGEIGLEYYDLETQKQYILEARPELISLDDEQIKDKQKEVFISQIELAHKLHLPIVIHTRDATKDTIEILKEYKNLITDGGLIHCFSGSIDTAKEYLKLGFYISVGGVVTFKNAKNLPDVIKEIGIEKLVLETDCPYLCPEPYRGKLNEPKNIPIIADKIAEILEISVLEVEETTTKNAYRLFGRLK